MKYTIAKEHYDFFQKEGFVEFEEVLTEQQLAEINQEISSFLAKSLHISERALPMQPSEKLYKLGRDLWRQCPAVKKSLLHKRWTNVAAELTEAPLLRIGYDQLIPADISDNTASTLIERGSIQGVVCAALFTLESDDRVSDEDAPPLFPSPTAGNVIFIKKDAPIDLSSITSLTTGRYLLVVYADAKAVYTHNENDSNTHTLKSLGYVYGDRLKDTLNPILYRRRG